MKRLVVACSALLILSCSRTATQGQIGTVDLVPSRDRVYMRNDAEPVVTTWRSLGLSYPSAKGAILYGLVISDAPLLDPGGKAGGVVLRRGSRVTVTDAGGWQPAGRSYRRLYQVREEGAGAAREGWLDSSSVALVTAASGSLSAGFLEKKIAISGGESEYNLLVLCHGNAVTLLDTSALVFNDSFHPSGVTHISIEDVNGDGVPEVVVEAETIVSLQFLGASPLSWEAWLRERNGAWGAIFRYNIGYGTDQGNSYSASRHVFSETGSGAMDTVKVTTDVVETVAQGEFHATIVTFFRWNGSAYKEDPAAGLPQQGLVAAPSAVLRAEPKPDGAAVETLRSGDALFVFDRGDTRQSLAGQPGFWLHATARSGKDGWIFSPHVKLSKIDPLKINRDVFLGHSGVSPSPQTSP